MEAFLIALSLMVGPLLSVLFAFGITIVIRVNAHDKSAGFWLYLACSLVGYLIGLLAGTILIVILGGTAFLSAGFLGWSLSVFAFVVCMFVFNYDLL